MYQFHTTKLTIILLKCFPLIHISHDSMANTTVQNCDIQPFSLFTLWALGMCLYPFSWRNSIKSSSVPEVLIPRENISLNFIFQLISLLICIMHRNYNRCRKYRSPMCRLEYTRKPADSRILLMENKKPPPPFFCLFFVFMLISG